MNTPSGLNRRAACFALCLAVIAAAAVIPAHAASYKAVVLTADQTGMGAFTDVNLQNAWGISYSPSGDFWVSDNNSGLSTLYIGSGAPQSLVVTIPPAAGGTKGSPTGTVYNSSADFVLGGLPSVFLFVTEDGTISGWTGAGTNAQIGVDNSTSQANYKGMEIANNGTGNFLYVANFHAGTIDVFNKTFTKTSLAGSFHDSGIPSGYAPFNIRNIGGIMYVLYAKQNATKTDATFCAGCGYVDEFDLNGNFLKRLITKGSLNAPWGIVVAPSNFGTFSSDLIVGNLGDGKINAFNPTTGALLGPLKTSAGKAIAINGLWDLKYGNGGSGGKTTELFYTSGPSGYVHGHFGKITAQ